MPWLVFDSPWLPWLLPPSLAAAAWLHARAAAPLAGRRRAVAVGARLLGVAALVLSAAGTSLVRPTDRLCVVVVADVSDSVPRDGLEAALARVRAAWAEQARPGDQVALVAFARGARVDALPGERLPVEPPAAGLDGSASDLAGALRLAGALFPEGAGRRVLLLGDGRSTTGDAASEVAALAQAGAEVWAVAVASAAGREVLVERLDVPPEVREGEPYPVTVALRADHAGRGTLKVFRDRSLVSEEPVTYASGRTLVRLQDRAEGAALRVYRAELDAPGEGGAAANNRGEAYAFTLGRDAVLWVHGETPPAPGLLLALRGAGLVVEARDAAACPRRLVDLAGFAAVVLDGVAADGLGIDAMAALGAYVRDTGGGLLALGGPRTFGAGGWWRTPLEEVLPVTMDVTGRRAKRRSALVVALDVSGSMSYEERGVQKVHLAAEGACRAAELLQPGDLFGVLAVTTEAEWVVPLRELPPERRPLQAKLRELRAGGGGIYVHLAVARAAERLRSVEAALRHLVVFADTSDAEQPVGPGREHVHDLAERLAAEGITVSTVGIGHRGDGDIPLLRGLALRGQGRWYFTEDMFSIPALFSQETMLAARNVVVDEPRNLVRLAPSPLVAGLQAVPSVGGYVATSARPLATVVLAAEGEDRDPVLASWHCGAGRAVAFTPGLRAPWGGPWLAWPELGRFLVGAVRWVARGRGGEEVSLRMSREGARVAVTAEVRGPGGTLANLAALSLRLVRPAPLATGLAAAPATAEMLRLQQRAPGRYEASFALGGPGTYVADLEGDLGAGTHLSRVGALSLAYSPEYEGRGADLGALERLGRATGGRLLADGAMAGLGTRARVPGRAVVDATRALLLLALCLWLLDAAARRCNVRAGALRTWLAPAEGARRPAGDEVTVAAAVALVRRLREEAPRGAPPTARVEVLDGSRAAERRAERTVPPVAPPAAPPQDEYMARLLAAKRKARGGR